MQGILRSFTIVQKRFFGRWSKGQGRTPTHTINWTVWHLQEDCSSSWLKTHMCNIWLYIQGKNLLVLICVPNCQYSEQPSFSYNPTLALIRKRVLPWFSQLFHFLICCPSAVLGLKAKMAHPSELSRPFHKYSNPPPIPLHSCLMVCQSAQGLWLTLSGLWNAIGFRLGDIDVCLYSSLHKTSLRCYNNPKYRLYWQVRVSSQECFIHSEIHAFFPPTPGIDKGFLMESSKQMLSFNILLCCWFQSINISIGISSEWGINQEGLFPLEK